MEWEAAIAGKHAGVLELEAKFSAVGGKYDVDSPMPCGVEGVVGNDGVVVGVIVDPADPLTNADCYGKRGEAILIGYKDLHRARPLVVRFVAGRNPRQ